MTLLLWGFILAFFPPVSVLYLICLIFPFFLDYFTVRWLRYVVIVSGAIILLSFEIAHRYGAVSDNIRGFNGIDAFAVAFVACVVIAVSSSIQIARRS
jgi:hypothetical protein